MATDSTTALMAWLEEKQKGAALLAALEQQLARLQSSDHLRPHETVQKIAAQVSSPLLTAYASGRKPLVQHPSGDMDAISSCLSGLLSHQQSLHHIFEGFKQAADVAYQEAAVVAEAANAASTDSDEALEQDDHLISPVLGTGHRRAGSDISLRSSSSAESVEGSLRLLCIADGLKQELELTDRVIRSVSLDMSLEELSTYQLMWQLQPYLNPQLLREAISSPEMLTDAF